MKPGLGSLKVIGTDTSYRSATYDFLLTFRGNYGPISCRFRDEQRFQSKIANGLCILHPDEGVLLELGISAWGQKLESWGYQAEKDVCFSRLDTIQYTNVADRRTDGWTPADSKDCANAWRRTVKQFLHTHHYTRLWRHSKANTAEQIVLS